MRYFLGMIIKNLKVESLAYNGYGVAKKDGKVYFIDYAVPGDILDATITKDKKKYFFCKIDKIITPSKKRVDPKCNLFTQCGGCSWQNVEYKTQLEAKIQIVKDTLHKANIDESKISGIVYDREYNYRNKAQFKSKKNILGFFEKESHKIIEVEYCHLMQDKINAELTKIRKKYTKINKENVLISTKKNGTPKTTFSNGRKQQGFAQVNSKVNRYLVRIITELIKKLGDVRDNLYIIDLFCGDGNLSLGLSGLVKKVVGYDLSSDLIYKANRATKKLTDETGYDYVCKSAEIPLAGRNSKATCLIIDPPRNGIKKGIEDIAGSNVPLVIYVSCNPATLTRDLKVFQENGYQINNILLLDMFPQTYHIETITVLSKVNLPELHKISSVPPEDANFLKSN